MESEDWRLRRSVLKSLKILLTAEVAGLVLSLTAGACLIAQLGEFSQCILFSYEGQEQLHRIELTVNISFSEGESLSYGDELTCDLVGYGLLVLVMTMFVLVCLTVSQMSAISAISGQAGLKKQRKVTRISWRSLCLHLTIFLLSLTCSAALLAGYFTSCSSFNHFVRQNLQEKLNQAEWRALERSEVTKTR